MFRNHYTTIAAWIIVYISLWLSRDNLVSSKFSKNNCHTGFVSRIIETMIFPFQWYKNRPTYEYVVGLVLLCCISVVAVIKCFSVFSSIEQPMIEAIFEHSNFTFISTVCAVCGYYCLIVDVPHFEKIIYRSAAVIFIGFAIVSFAFPFVFLVSTTTLIVDAWLEHFAPSKRIIKRGVVLRRYPPFYTEKGFFIFFSFYADALNGATGYGRRYASAGGADDP